MQYPVRTEEDLELCGPALGNALISLFGSIPEAWKTKVNSAISRVDSRFIQENRTPPFESHRLLSG
jgi:hypothetical protein